MRTGGRTTKRSSRTEAGRTVPRGSEMSTGTIGTLAGRQSLGGTLATIMIFSTDAALDWELAKIGRMAELLAAITLRDDVLVFQVLDGNTEVQKAREGTERRLNVLVMSKHPKRHEVSGANAISSGNWTPHLANSRDDETLSRKLIKDDI